MAAWGEDIDIRCTRTVDAATALMGEYGISFLWIGQCNNNVGVDIFNRGLCLPSDNKITPEQQDGDYRDNSQEFLSDVG